MILQLILLFSFFHYGRAQRVLNPVPVPLAVRSPYFNCWGVLNFAGGIQNTSILSTSFFNEYHHHPDWDPSLESFDLVVYVRVDNNTFLFLRDGFDPTFTDVNLTNVAISPTQTMLTAEAGPMQVNLTFLNPIEPKDWVKQSIPLSYLSLTAKSLDGAAHAVQVYSDLSAEWVSGNRSQEIYWMGIDDDSIIGYRVKRQNPTLSEKVSTFTEWGTLYHLMEMGDNITSKIADHSVSRDLFLHNGMLDATDASNSPRLIPNSTVFAMSRDLGTIQATRDPIVWVVGYATDPVINYTDLSGTPPQQRSPFYKTQYSDDRSLVIDFISDFANASSRAQKLDQKILQGAASFSGPLGDLVSLTTAEIYGNTQLTVAIDASGEFNKSDVMAFMRDMDANRVNPVETLFSAFPAFMYIDPDLGGLLLEPLFRLQASLKYPNPYAAPDLETSYPDVTVSISANNRGVENSGNMLIMTYAHARASGDVSLISRYYDLLNSWTDYLSDSVLLIHDQYSADGLSTDNQTNLAIKGIIAIKAMSQMSSFVNKTTDFDKYSNTSSRLYAQWKSLALAGDNHLLAAYGQIGSWTLGYNLFADVWLNTSVVESSVYDSQSSFINNLSLAPAFASGMPVDSLSSDKSVILGWNMFVAAITPNQDLRTDLISIVYSVRTGQHFDIPTRAPDAAMGAMYAPLALTVPVKLIASPTLSPTTTGTSSKSHIIRGVLCGVAALLAIVAISMIVWRRRRQSHGRTSIGSPFEASSLGEDMSQGTQVTLTPFDPTRSALPEVAPVDARPQTDSQERLVHRSSSLEDAPLPLRRVVSFPVGLSSKELARLRRSPANGSRSQPMDGPPSDPPLTATADRGALRDAAAAASPSLEAWVPRSEVDALRHEIQRLHAVISESPPSYASGAA